MTTEHGSFAGAGPSGKARLAALTRFNQQVKDLAEGAQGGVRLDNCTDLREKDVLESLKP